MEPPDLVVGEDSEQEGNMPFGVYAGPVGVDGRVEAAVGLEHWKRGEFKEAEGVFRKALVLWRNDVNLWVLLGGLYGHIQDHNRCINCCREAVALQPKSALALHALGAAYGNAGAHALCLEWELKAMEADPDFAPARDGVGLAYQKVFRMKDAMAEYVATVRRYPNNLDALSHLCLASIYMPETTPESLYITHRYYGEVAEREAGDEPVIDREWRADKKLRVGFFGGDFKKHSVSYFMEPLIRDLDRSQFEVYIYYFGRKDDEVTQRFKGYADKWMQTVAHKAYLPLLLEDKLDVAFDLGGHTAHSLTFFASRVAPVQIVYMGYPSTTGLTRMDYRFTDEWADPTGEADKWHTERLVRLPGSGWTYLPSSEAPEVAMAPYKFSGKITFGSFNNFQKMSHEQLVTWRKLLDRVPGSRLLLKSGNFGDPAIGPGVKERLDAAGFGDRVEMMEWKATTREHLEMYSKVDIALDPVPFNGATTTCEALYMGVPVIVIEGDRHAARVGVALLNAIGRSEWIARSDEDFINKAVGLANSGEYLNTIRPVLRKQFEKSPLMDYPGQARRFETAIRNCWTNRCKMAHGTLG